MTDNKLFWRRTRPLFTDKVSVTNKIILSEQDDIITDNKRIASTFNNYFVNVTNTLSIKEWP